MDACGKLPPAAAHLGQLTKFVDTLLAYRGTRDLATDDHTDRAFYLNQPANTLQSHLEHQGASEDLAYSMTTHRAEAESTLDNKPSECLPLCDLSISLIMQYNRCK